MEIGNDLQLYKTPMVLTLQGEFEDDEFNEIYPTNGAAADDDDDDDDDDDMELSLEELLKQEDDGLEEEDDDDSDDRDDRIISANGDKVINEQSEQRFYDDDDDDDDDDDSDIVDDDDEEEEEDNTDLSSFWNSSPMGRLSEELSNRPDYSIMRPTIPPDMSDIPSDAYVTIDDEKSLQKAHRKADRIIEYAKDVKLMASFHYK